MEPLDALVIAGLVLFAGLGLFNGLIRGVSLLFVVMIAAFLSLGLGPVVVPALPYSLSAPALRAPAAAMLLLASLYTIMAFFLNMLLRGPLHGSSLHGDLVGGVVLAVVRGVFVVFFMVVLFERTVPVAIQPDWLRNSHTYQLLSPLSPLVCERLPESTRHHFARLRF